MNTGVQRFVHLKIIKLNVFLYHFIEISKMVEFSLFFMKYIVKIRKKVK